MIRAPRINPENRHVASLALVGWCQPPGEAVHVKLSLLVTGADGEEHELWLALTPAEARWFASRMEGAAHLLENHPDQLQELDALIARSTAAGGEG